MKLKDIGALIGVAEPGIATLKVATETVQNIKALITKPNPDLHAMQKEIAALYEEIVVTKQAYVALYDALLELQQKEKKAQTFKAEAARYAMTKTELGSTVFSLRPAYAGDEPAHDLCATCFQNEVKSILQPVAHNTLKCGQCGGTFYKPDGQDSGIRIGGVRRPDFDGFI